MKLALSVEECQVTNMTTRQETILHYIIEYYVKTALPVGSKMLAEKLDCSPATVRNEMSALEKEGYIYQPHTSAGRVPTDKGYRYYVNLLMEGKSLSKEDQVKLQSDLLKLQAQYKRLARVTAKLLSLHSQSMVVSGIKEQEEYATSGLQKLLDQPEFEDKREVASVCEALDQFEDTVDVLLDHKPKERQVQTFIGSENPVSEMNKCSLLISEFELPNGEHGVIAVLGPKRMRYDKNISLVSYLSKLLSGGSLVLLISFTLI
ncbi:HTH domain-containing protein [Patescibacteria group bacterium]|nr:HTH domain-containing protein [Patescibacteria group bacterium]